MSNLSIVIPIRNQAKFLNSFLDKLQYFLEHSRKTACDIIFIDDGSDDETFSLLKLASSKDSRIRIVRLAKSYGLEAALRAGIPYVTGECGILLIKDFDSSLRLLPKMLDAWQHGEHIVFSITEPIHSDHNLKQVLLNSINHQTRDISRIGCCLLNRIVIDSLVQFSATPVSWLNLVFSTGLRPFYVRYKPTEQDQMAFDQGWYNPGSTGLLTPTFFVGISLLGLALMVITILLAVIFGIFHLNVLPEFSRIMIEITLFAIGMSTCIVGGIGYLLFKASVENNLKPFYVVDSLVNVQASNIQPKDKIDQLLLNLSSTRRRKSTSNVEISHEIDASQKSG